nr:MAG TPA: hypothetical protein [Caudoviricetes sp.]
MSSVLDEKIKYFFCNASERLINQCLRHSKKLKV